MKTMEAGIATEAGWWRLSGEPPSEVSQLHQLQKTRGKQMRKAPRGCQERATGQTMECCIFQVIINSRRS